MDRIHQSNMNLTISAEMNNGRKEQGKEVWAWKCFRFLTKLKNGLNCAISFWPRLECSIKVLEDQMSITFSFVTTFQTYAYTTSFSRVTLVSFMKPLLCTTPIKKLNAVAYDNEGFKQ